MGFSVEGVGSLYTSDSRFDFREMMRYEEYASVYKALSSIRSMLSDIPARVHGSFDDYNHFTKMRFNVAFCRFSDAIAFLFKWCKFKEEEKIDIFIENRVERVKESIEVDIFKDDIENISKWVSNIVGGGSDRYSLEGSMNFNNVQVTKAGSSERVVESFSLGSEIVISVEIASSVPGYDDRHEDEDDMNYFLTMW